MRPLLILLLLNFTSGCTTTARITNTPIDETIPVNRTARGAKTETLLSSRFTVVEIEHTAKTFATLSQSIG